MNQEKKSEKELSPDVSPAAEGSGAGVGSYSPALGEIYQRLYPEMKRPKPSQEAIAAALQAMQRLTMKMDSETAAEQSASEEVASAACGVCGHRNREGNRFCAMCGLPIDAAAAPTSPLPVAAPVAATAAPAQPSGPEGPLALAPPSRPAAPEETPAHPAAAGPHHYHHHYHHHYFPAAAEIAAAPASRAEKPESAREADRLRLAAAAKGEPISRGEAAVRRLTQEWVLACNTRQLDELLELYAPDALVVRSNVPVLRGAAQVREFFHSVLESGLGEVALDPIRIEVLGDLAHEVGRYSALVPGATGKRREERGKYLWVFARQSGGEWRLVSECWSSDLTLHNSESDLPAAPAPTTKLPRR